MSTCDRREEAPAFLEGVLSTSEALAYAQHAASCPDCKKALSDAAIGLAVLRAHDPEVFEDPTSHTTTAPPPVTPPANNVRWFAGVVMVAAAVLLVVTMGTPPTHIQQLGDGPGQQVDPTPPTLFLSAAHGAVHPGATIPADVPLHIEVSHPARLFVLDASGFVPLVPAGTGVTTGRSFAPGNVQIVAVRPDPVSPLDAADLLRNPTAALRHREATTHTFEVAPPPP